MQCISFGKPFHERVDSLGRVRPGPPEPKYPGISPTAFDPCGQLQAYEDLLKKEKQGRCLGQEVAARMDQLRQLPPEGGAMRLGDLMPGFSSLRSYYDGLGYTVHPISGKPVPPAAKAAAKAQAPRQAPVALATHAAEAQARAGAGRALQQAVGTGAPAPVPRPRPQPQLQAPPRQEPDLPHGGGRALSEAPLLRRSISAPSGLAVSRVPLQTQRRTPEAPPLPSKAVSVGVGSRPPRWQRPALPQPRLPFF